MLNRNIELKLFSTIIVIKTVATEIKIKNDKLKTKKRYEESIYFIVSNVFYINGDSSRSRR
jgi:hypothetical protein